MYPKCWQNKDPFLLSLDLAIMRQFSTAIGCLRIVHTALLSTFYHPPLQGLGIPLSFCCCHHVV